ncbi:MAG: hypothetical protein ACR2O3_07555 [Rhizobiaceae bacterium]
MTQGKLSKTGYAMVLFAAALGLSACNPNKEVAGPPILNGNWASSDGVYTAQFLNGSFRATANDTGGLISEGEYIALAEDRIQIKWSGLVSGRSNQAECIKPDANQLDCVDLNGNKFSLRRTN